MKLQFRESAPEGSRFAPDSWADQIGRAVEFTIEGRTVGEGRVEAAEIVDDGRAVLLTLDVPERMFGVAGRASWSDDRDD